MATRFVLPLFAFIAFVLFCAVPTIEGAVTSAKLQGYPDLPSPLAKLKTVSAGSLVIAMDDLQLANAKFNIRAYGNFFLLFSSFISFLCVEEAEADDDGCRFQVSLCVCSTPVCPCTGSFVRARPRTRPTSPRWPIEYVLPQKCSK
jgi:hypothetical protein